MRADGREVFLEVVSERAEDELRSVEAALDIGVDWLLGGTHPDEALWPSSTRSARPARPAGRATAPSRAASSAIRASSRASIDEIADSARALTARDGVDGLDLLAYRWTGDVPALVRAVVDASAGPVIAAGSVDSAARIHALQRAGAWAFTIGGAIFDRQLPAGPSVREQVECCARHDARPREGRWSPTVPEPSRPRRSPTTWRRTDAANETRPRRDQPDSRSSAG